MFARIANSLPVRHVARDRRRDTVRASVCELRVVRVSVRSWSGLGSRLPGRHVKTLA